VKNLTVGNTWFGIIYLFAFFYYKFSILWQRDYYRHCTQSVVRFVSSSATCSMVFNLFLQVPRLLKVTSEECPYFKIVSPSNCAHKVGAGLPTTYKVLFTPDDRKVLLPFSLLLSLTIFYWLC